MRFVQKYFELIDNLIGINTISILKNISEFMI